MVYNYRRWNAVPKVGVKSDLNFLASSAAACGTPTVGHLRLPLRSGVESSFFLARCRQRDMRQGEEWGAVEGQCVSYRISDET